MMEQLLIQAEILWPALLAGLIILTTHVPLGREVLQRGIIFLDLAIAQMAALGVVVANIIWLGDDAHVSQTLVAVGTAIAGSMGLYRLRKLEIKVQEAIIGILFILAATGSILLLAADPHGGERLKEILVGQILWLEPKSLLPLALAYATILIIWYGLRERMGAWLFYPLFAITITLSTQVVGVYLVFASLIIPNLVTLYQQHPRVKSFVLGTVGYGSGLVMSALLDLPAGAAIVWCLALVALGYYIFCTCSESKK
ncbi:MAG: zinc/manganese transport system permease protein [Kiritimatiellia bacterium]|jgi:zinc/manganese transport system permease protein